MKIIRNVLPEEYAKKLSFKLYNRPMSEWWNAIRYGDSNYPEYLPTTSEGTSKLESLNTEINSSLQQDKFTYKLKRSVTHRDCSCFECEFRTEVLESEWFKNIIIDNTTLTNPYIHEAFTTLYDKGNFLGTHTDRAMDCAYILHLTPDWKPEYGGLLHVKQEDGSYQAITPEFNSLVLMDLNTTKNIPHFVSEVSSTAPRGRVAFTGWYNETK